MKYSVSYKKYGKLPNIRLENLNFEEIEVNITGGIEGIYKFSRKFVETWATHYQGPPEHYVLKIAPEWGIFKKRLCPHSEMDITEIS